MTSKTRSILLAAVLATPVAFFTPSAEAQFRVDTGAANDANNRIGSGGYNGPGRSLNINSGDYIVTGNVTGGREFRGRAASTDPNAFRGRTAGGLSDAFIRNSASAYENNAQQVKRFYGVSEGTPPPPNFIEVTPGSQAYTPAPPPQRISSDIRMGSIYNSDRTQFTDPQFGELLMPGLIDNSNTQSLLRASPLYGVVQDDPATMSDGSRAGFSNFRRRAPGLDDRDVQAARNELRDDLATDQPVGDASKLPGGELNLGARNAIGSPLEAPDSPRLPGQNIDSSLSNQALGGQIKIEGSQRNELVPPAEQSTQYAELHNRFGKIKPTGPMTDQQAQNLYRQEKDTRERDIEREKRGDRPGLRPAGGGRVTFPGGGAPAVGSKTPQDTDEVVKAPTEPKTTDMPAITGLPREGVAPVPKPAPGGEGPAIDTTEIRPGQPLKITSLGEGMKSGRVKDMLVAAEDLLRQQKYTGAIEQYDLVERVVPNNPLVTLGRANAELGASYYARAENNIRKAIDADNALLIAQFDLVRFLGKDRIAFLEKDLKEITTTEPKHARAPFLLAWLKYHTGDKKMASNYLALSEQRLGKEDPLYKQMRRTWDLPKANPLPEVSK